MEKTRGLHCEKKKSISDQGSEVILSTVYLKTLFGTF